ncbi:MAG: methionyl-tRNA formyltransferase [Clostridia bacterium]|nr:methionyl-tRNA formyltransferase [Clostridia bacterium]
MAEPLPIIKVEHPVLRQVARPVRNVNRRLRELLDRMAATMYAADGVGLAAPQVGVSLRAIVVDVGDGLVALANPEILEASEEREVGLEGCLSIPGVLAEVERPARVRVTGLDRNGRRVWLDASELLARALQHEIDHLDGVLITDKALRVWDRPPETTLRVVFMGTPAFAVPSLRALVDAGCRPVAVVTRPDRPRGRGLAPAPTPVRQDAERLGLPVLTPETTRDPAFLEELRRLAPDLVLCVAYGRILPPALLTLPRLGCVNVHPSLLPKYRGEAPIQRALWDGAEETGVTVLYMTEEVDAGDIILQRRLPIAPDDDYGRLHDRLAAAAADLLPAALRLLAIGRVRPRPPDPAAAPPAPAVTRQDEFIDWRRPARAIVNQVRALSPRPGAETAVAGRRLKVLKAEALPREEPAEPGGVLSAGGADGLVVAAGEGAVRLLVVKPAGGRAMSADDYLNGHPLALGVAFG